MTNDGAIMPLANFLFYLIFRMTTELGIDGAADIKKKK